MKTRRRQPYTVIDLCPDDMRAALRLHPQGLTLARDYLEASDATRTELRALWSRPSVVRTLQQAAERKARGA